MAIIKLQREPIDVGYYYNLLKDAKYGGIDLFVGTVREWTAKTGEREHTDFIEYTAYEEMAVKELEKLAAPVEARGDRVVIVHRLGKLELTDEAVFIGVASAHREAAFEGCHSIIDKLKETVPIWKKEVDGEGKNLVERWGK
jgi:molybdopterin synthase catalytic subunit